ncbi:MAG: hypothetical protein LBU32_31750 [Clostridiales bacterium]|nr:hypothetical protein [Clostridiales bacterium]
MTIHWQYIFKKKLGLRTWAKELIGVRSQLDYFDENDFPESDAWRALDTMSRVR